MVRFTCVGISSLVGSRLFIPMHVKVPNHNYIYNRLPEDGPSFSKQVEEIKIKILI